jgi:hypothetical protein
MFVILIKSVFIFSFCVLFHILIWRLIPQRIRHGLNYINILFWLLLIFLGIGSLFGYSIAGIPLSKNTVHYPIDFQFLPIIFFHFFASLIYIHACVALNVFSPSMELLKIVERNMPEGIIRTKVEIPLNKASLFEERYQNLLSTKMVEMKDERFYLTWRGQLIANIFFMYINLLGLSLEKGG